MSFDQEAEAENLEEISTGCDALMTMHKQDSKARDDELQHLDSWIASKVESVGRDNADFKLRKDDRIDGVEDLFTPVYERQMTLKSQTSSSARGLLDGFEQKMKEAKARERKLLRLEKDKSEARIGDLNAKYDQLDNTYKTLEQKHKALRAELVSLVHCVCVMESLCSALRNCHVTRLACKILHI